MKMNYKEKKNYWQNSITQKWKCNKYNITGKIPAHIKLFGVLSVIKKRSRKSRTSSEHSELMKPHITCTAGKYIQCTNSFCQLLAALSTLYQAANADFTLIFKNSQRASCSGLPSIKQNLCILTVLFRKIVFRSIWSIFISQLLQMSFRSNWMEINKSK